MRHSRPRYPKAKEVAMVLHALAAAVPMDYKPRIGWRESEKLVPNLRVSTSTQGIEWTVDIYSGSYFVTRVGSRLTEICTSIPSVVAYLRRMLSIRI